MYLHFLKCVCIIETLVMAKRAQYKGKWVATVQALRNDDATELYDSTDNELSGTNQEHAWHFRMRK